MKTETDHCPQQIWFYLGTPVKHLIPDDDDIEEKKGGTRMNRRLDTLLADSLARILRLIVELLELLRQCRCYD